MNKKAVIFDMDGVIYDTERVYLEEWLNIFTKHGYKMTQEIYVAVMGTGRKNVIKTFKETFGQDLPIEVMYEEKDAELFRRIEEEGIPLKIGVIELLEYLKESGYKIALATSAKKERVAKQLRDEKLKSFFDAIVCSEDVEKGKPNPDIFLKAAALLNMNPKDCFVVEDSSAGIMAAYRAGMRGLHVEDLKAADENIKKHASGCFKNLFEIKEYIKKNDISDLKL